MKPIIPCLLLFCAANARFAFAEGTTPKDTIRPLTNVHAHNAYEHPRPLLDALDNGFCSVEADIHLVDGKLLGAHDRAHVRTERTLESLYLAPLRERAKKNGGRIYPGGPRSIILLIDVKTDAASTYAMLRPLLARYQDILTELHGDKITSRAVTVVLSGNRPPITALRLQNTLFTFYDGRLSDLGKKYSPRIMPIVSQSWSAVSSWQGKVGTNIPAVERKQIQDIVTRTHRQGYRIRFWGTPDTKTTWQAMRDLQIDLINTDDLAGLREFLTQETTRF